METVLCNGMTKWDEYMRKMTLCKQKWKNNEVEKLGCSNFLILEMMKKTIENKGKFKCGKLCGKCV